MKRQLLALQAELIKIKHSTLVWSTFVAFGLAPLMGAVFILIVQDEEALQQAGELAMKAKAMNFQADWRSYLDILTQAVGVGGVLIFGFVASWLFGREYSDGTAKDLLAVPVSRTKILNAKFLLYASWCVALAISNLLVALLLSFVLQLAPLDPAMLPSLLSDYLITTLLTIMVGVPIAFFALWGKGYLAPLGFVALTLVFAQVVAATGYGAYFPWAVPGLFSGSGGAYKMLLNEVSYGIVVLTGLVGYWATIRYWSHADHKK